jgi:molybdenum cofactor cytidylyltransferase
MGEGPTAGVILAAGISRRLGRPKQLLALGGRTLVEWVIEAALGSELARVVLVLGHEAQAITRALEGRLDDPRLDVAINARYLEGMARSLRAGLLRVKDEFPSVMFLLGDQPFLDSSTIDLLLERFWGSDKEICVPLHAGARRNPVIMGNGFYQQLLAIEGDTGARQIIDAHPDHVLFVKLQAPSLFMDIDSEEDLSRASAFLDPE